MMAIPSFMSFYPFEFSLISSYHRRATAKCPDFQRNQFLNFPFFCLPSYSLLVGRGFEPAGHHSCIPFDSLLTALTWMASEEAHYWHLAIYFETGLSPTLMWTPYLTDLLVMYSSRWYWISFAWLKGNNYQLEVRTVLQLHLDLRPLCLDPKALLQME